jgi:hypothetical protein
VSENVFCTPGARKPPPTALPGAKKSRNTQKTLLNHSARNGFWTPQVAAPRSNPAPRPSRAAPTVGAPLGACGRTAYAVIPSPPWHLGPDCDGFWPRASILPLKSGAQSNQPLVHHADGFDLRTSIARVRACAATYTRRGQAPSSLPVIVTSVESRPPPACTDGATHEAAGSCGECHRQYRRDCNHVVYVDLFLNDNQKLLAARPKWHSSSDNLEHIMQRLESLERTAALTPGVTAAVAATAAPPAPLMQRTPHSPPPPAAARVDGVHTSIIPRLTLRLIYILCMIIHNQESVSI